MQPLTEWAGDKGWLRRLALQFRNFMIPGNGLTCGGRITAKAVEDGKGRVDLELWVKNQDGVVCVPGKGVVELPMPCAQASGAVTSHNVLMTSRGQVLWRHPRLMGTVFCDRVKRSRSDAIGPDTFRTGEDP